MHNLLYFLLFLNMDRMSVFLIFYFYMFSFPLIVKLAKVAKPGIVSRSDAKRRQATPSDAKRRQATPSDAKRRQATPSDAKRRQATPSCAFFESKPSDAKRRE